MLPYIARALASGHHQRRRRQVNKNVLAHTHTKYNLHINEGSRQWPELKVKKKSQIGNVQ